MQRWRTKDTPIFTRHLQSRSVERITRWSDNPIPDLKNVPLSELPFRSSQMGKCATVDSEWEKAFNRTYAEGKNDAPVDYRALEAIFLGAQGMRAARFIERHHLMDQYLKEDEEKIGR